LADFAANLRQAFLKPRFGEICAAFKMTNGIPIIVTQQAEQIENALL
jgi:hypothetical protein